MSDKWYYDVKTGEVSNGPATGFVNRLGPYATKEEAENALAIAAARTEAADEYDAEDDD